MGELEPLHCDFGRQVPFTPLAVHVLGVLGLGLGDPDEAVGVQHWTSVGSSGQYPGVDSLEPLHCDVGKHVPFAPVVLTVHGLGGLGDPDGLVGVQHLRRSSVSSMIRQMVPQPLPGHS